jgi:hypothetical protein
VIDSQVIDYFEASATAKANCDKLVFGFNSGMDYPYSFTTNNGNDYSYRLPMNSGNYYIYRCGPGSSVGIATELRAGRSGVRISLGGEIFCTFPDRTWGPPSLLYNGYQVFLGGRKRPGRDTDSSSPSSAVVMKG